MRQVTRALVVLVLAAIMAFTGRPAQSAEANGNGLLRLAHLSPDTPAVDVYVDSVADPEAGIVLNGVGYGAVSEYQDVPPGEYTVSMREAGAAPDAPAVLSTTVRVDADSARTVAGVGLFEELGLEIIEDALETPPEGQARVRVLAGAAGAETLDVTLGGTAIASGLPFASTGEYVDVPAGAADLQVSAAGGPPSAVPVELDAGAVYSLVVLDDSGGLTVEPVLDAASMGVVPQGGVETGGGGGAGAGSGLVTAGVLTVLALAAVGVRAVARPRHAARRR